MDINAIIMAAGKGTRLYPLTEKTPKPLIKVHGVPMIETIINSLIKKGIADITIVTGYKKEQFDYLKEKYQVNIVFNKDFEIANNISSLYYARNKLKKTIILDGDQIIKNEDIVKTNFDKSGYICVPINTFKKEWILELDSDNKIISCLRDGGDSGCELKSLSFWTEEDSAHLKDCLEMVYIKNKQTNLYWDDVAMFVCKDDFKLYGFICKENDIIEIDSLEDLKKEDKTYCETNY